MEWCWQPATSKVLKTTYYLRSWGVDQGYFIDGSLGNFLKLRRGAHSSKLQATCTSTTLNIRKRSQYPREDSLSFFNKNEQVYQFSYKENQIVEYKNNTVQSYEWGLRRSKSTFRYIQWTFAYIEWRCRICITNNLPTVSWLDNNTR